MPESATKNNLDPDFLKGVAESLTVRVPEFRRLYEVGILYAHPGRCSISL